MKIAITGAKGLVGKALIEIIDTAQYMVLPIDLPEYDVADYDSLVDITRDTDVIVHFAWKDLIQNVRSNTRDPVNMQMVGNVYRTAVENGIGRVIMGSSNQAHGYDVRDSDGKIRPTTKPDKPDNQYGHEKLEMEAMGKEYAEKHGLEVVCLRIGNVNQADEPKPTTDGRPQRWLSKRDLGRLVTACLEAERIPKNFQIIYGVSEGPVYDWVNSVGYVPLDHAD